MPGILQRRRKLSTRRANNHAARNANYLPAKSPKDSRIWARLSKTNNHQTQQKKKGKQAYVDDNEKIKGKRKWKNTKNISKYMASRKEIMG